MRRIFGSLSTISILALSGLAADEGRIPIFGPRNIQAPGHYVLTRDFSIAGGTALVINVNNVILDLNGHSVTNTSTAGDVIVVDPNVTEGVVIRNGRIIGGQNGIDTPQSNKLSVRIENLDISGTSVNGVVIRDADTVDVVNCHIHDVGASGIVAIAFSAPFTFTGRFSGNKIERVGADGISLNGVRHAQVVHNVVVDYGSAGVQRVGIEIDTAGGVEAGGNLIESNVVTSLPRGIDDDGILIVRGSDDNILKSNVLKRVGRYGILAHSDENRIENNMVSRCGSDGILVGIPGSPGFTFRNHLEGNQAQGNAGCGINFANTNFHSYRDNVVRVNSGGGVCNGGLPNTDAGGNIL